MYHTRRTNQTNYGGHYGQITTIYPHRTCHYQ